MANEYLKRTPTSTGNRKVWTWSGWIKQPKFNGSTLYTLFSAYSSGYPNRSYFLIDSDGKLNVITYEDAYTLRFFSQNLFRDNSSWTNILFSVDTTKGNGAERVSLFSNGAKLKINETTYNEPSINYQTYVNLSSATHGIGYDIGLGGRPYNGQMSDVFFIDGQALTPDVFGFYKDGNGYISAGSTQSTDFRPGQWVPHSPRRIKSEINRRGGFGVNGFYLPMNSSNNFGADFHCEPDTILRLKSSLPQPKAEIDGTGDYTGALRDDPFKDYLVLAIPGVSGGLQNGFGDYSAVIRGSGSNKTLTANGNAGVAVTASYYGSALSFDGSGDSLQGPLNSSDLEMGSDDFTVEAWINPSDVSGPGGIAGIWDGSSNDRSWLLYHGTGGGINFIISGNGISNNVVASGINMITGQWYHVVGEKEGTTIRIIVNGVVAAINTSASSSVYDSSEEFRIGVYDFSDDTPDEFNGQIQDLRVYKGVAKYKGGFDVPKPYTPVGIGTWRAVPDTTANNFATLNPITPTIDSIKSNGNLTLSGNQQGGVNTSTIHVSSGKWYWEIRASQISNTYYGIASDLKTGAEYDTFIRLRMTGDLFILIDGVSSTNQTFTSYSAGDIISIALNVDDGIVTWYKNNVSIGSYSSVVITQKTWSPGIYANSTGVHVNFGQNPTFSGNTTAGTYTDSNGKGLFKYEPPAGFLALCEDNLPRPAISNPGEHFKTVLYTGTDSSRNITGVGFKPDFVWIKSRSTNYWHQVFDTIRGPGNRLYTNETEVEQYSGTTLRSFDNDGFSIGDDDGGINNGGDTYVAWCWRAGEGNTVTNTDGSITSQVSANQDAGFSIATYTGTGSALTFGHGLNKVPAFAIFKYRSGPSGGWAWIVYHKSLPTNYYVYLQSSVAQQNLTGVFTTAPASTLFSLGTEGAVNTNNNNMVCYSWAEIEGFSKFGSYVGNVNDDGPFVYCGFKPAWVMIKRADGVSNWTIRDSSRGSVNPNDKGLLANSSVIEGTGDGYKLDFLSNGFKIRDVDSDFNSSSTYIFAAFAESPFQTANAK